MKICRFQHNDKIQTGVIEGDLIFPCGASEILAVTSNTKFEKSHYVQRADVEFLLPIMPSKIICVGRNYAAHAAEMGNDVPKEPLLFLKAPSSLILHGEDIILPPQSSRVEHEGELSVFIGRVCKDLDDNDDPFDYIYGYGCLNDVTARDIQRSDVQFTRAKSFDTFCPVSFFVETELNVSALKVTTRVNDFIKQAGNTSEMVFPVPALVKYISRQMTLYPGDIIATGTPSGVSILKPGDFCEIEIEGIGILGNTVKA